jgi:uncharacterized protein YkwD
MPRAVRAGVAVTAAALTLLAVTSGSALAAHPHHRHRRSCPHTGVRAGARNLAAVRHAVLCLVNRERSSRGLPALREDRRLDRSAQGWTDTMVRSGQFSHGANFAGRISAAGFRWSQAGENIATGYPTAASVMAGWMASPGHCRNILDPGFSAIGIGMVPRAVPSAAGGPATWTQDFALPAGRRAPSRNGRPAAGCPY